MKELVATIASQDPEEQGKRLDIVLVNRFEVVTDTFSDGLFENRQEALDSIESSYKDGRFDLQWE